MFEIPALGKTRGIGQVLCGARQLAIVAHDRAAAAGGDGLVAVEAEHADAARAADRASPILAAERLGGILHQREPQVARKRGDCVEIDRMSVEVHRHDRPDDAAGVAVDDLAAAALRRSQRGSVRAAPGPSPAYPSCCRRNAGSLRNDLRRWRSQRTSSAGTITSSCGRTPARSRAACNAAVPLTIATAAVASTLSASMVSNRSTNVPAVETHPVSRHSLT